MKRMLLPGVRILKLLLAFIFFFSIAASDLYAGDIVINEFLVDPDSTQWIEIYNKGSSVITVGGWFIDDNGSASQKYTIPDGTTINSGEFKVFESSLFNFNKASADIAQLLNGSNIEDSYSYSTGPGENKSFGRQTDGTGAWVTFSTLTKGSTNNTATPIPTLTPTLIPTPTISNTPTPTKTPTPAPSATPTKTPTPNPTATYTPSPTKINPTLTIISTKINSTVQEVKAATDEDIPTPVLQKSEEAVTQTPTKVMEKKDTINYYPFILIGVGVVFIGAYGILSYLSYKKEKDGLL